MNLADELQRLQDLHRSGALTDAEFAAAKATVLGDAGDRQAGQQETPPQTDMPQQRMMAAQLEEIKHQNDVAALDRQWELQREQYMVVGQYGRRYIPTRGMSLFGGAMLAGFGILWTAIASSITGHFGGAADYFPLFGVVFILFGIGISIYSYMKAGDYEAAYRAYQRRRAQLLDRGGRED